MTELNQSESQWHQFLQDKGVNLTAEQLVTALPDQFITPIQHLGLLKLSGDDATHFLHGQLTNDVEHLTQQQAKLAGYCSAKGRLLATFLMWRDDTSIYLTSSADILPTIQKRLKMFVLRSKVTIDDIQTTSSSIGLFGEALKTPLSHLFGTLPTLPYEKITTELGTLICLPTIHNKPRYVWIATQQVLQQHWDELAQVAPAVTDNLWAYVEIMCGLPWITQATQEAFVPQMLNYEIIGGVNFKKGCYPGQEIVARTQYLGKIKRRMALFSLTNAQVNAGDELFSSEDPEQPCGKIVNAARLSADKSVCLAEIKLATLEAGTIHLGNAQGPTLQIETLPYNIQDNNSPE